MANLKLDRSDFNKGVSESEGSFSRLGGALAAGAKRVAMVGGAAIAAGGAVGLSTAARMEQASIGFTTMLGSGEKARVFLGELSAFAAKTPFEFPELQTAASSLVSAGVEADKVIPIMTSLGNATSGMGTGSEGVKRATVALQQMNAAGRITGEDLNQLRDAGIPVYDLLASATGKSKEEIVKLAQAGKLGKTELDLMMKALENGTGLEKFNGLMAAQSQSLTGMWSTLKDTFSTGMATAITPLIPLIKDGLGGATTLLADNMPRLASGLASVVTHIKGFVDGSDPVKTAQFAEAADTARVAVTGMGPAFRDAAAALPSMNNAVSVGGAVLSFLAGHLDTVIKYMPYLIAAFVAYKAAQALSNIAAIAAVPVQAALAISNVASAMANRQLAAAIVQQTVAQNVGTVSTGGGTIATIAHTVAGLAASAAAKAWAAGQWLLNAALSANPIGLVVLAIAALAGGLIYAYKNSETFRDIVKGAFDAVAGAVGWVVEKMGGLFGALSNVPGMGWAKEAADKMAGLATGTSGASASVDKLASSEDAAKTATDNLNAATQTTLDKFTLLNEGARSAARTEDAWKASLDAVTESVKQNGGSLDNNTAAGRANRSAIEGAASALNEKVKSDVAGMIKAGDLTGATRVATETFETNRRKLIDVAVQSGLSREAAERYAGQLLATPGQIATAILAPGLEAARREVQGLGVDINGLSDKTINIIANAKANGIIGWGVDKFGNMAEYAAGGAVHGPGTKTSDSIPSLLSDDEHVWTAGEVAKFGGHQAMLQFRGMVRRGEIGAYAAGGAVGRTVTVRGSSQAAELNSAVRGAMGVAVAAVQTAATATAARASATPVGTANGVGGLGPAAARAHAAVREVFGFTGTIGGYANRNIGGTNTPSKHSLGKAIDVMTYSNMALGQRVADFFVSNRGTYGVDNVIWNRRIANGRRGWQFGPYGGASPHTDHPHIDFFDRGGIARGTGMMPKFTSSPERVLSPRQTEAFDRLVDVLDRGIGGGAPNVRVFIGDRELTDIVRVELDDFSDRVSLGSVTA